MPKRTPYDPKALENAIIDVKNGLPKKAAAKKYGVPRATLQFRLSDKFVKASCGPSTVLSSEEEILLANWIASCARKGFPRRKEDIFLSVQEFIRKSGKKSPFTDDMPGRSWYKGFLSRHSHIVPRESEAVTRASACLSEKDIRRGFENITSYLQDENALDVLKDPSRVFNGDETNFILCPKTSKVLAIKGSRNVYEADQGTAKEAVTCMFSFSASGSVVPPMIIFPYVRVPKDIVDSVPDSWGVGHSTTGWMKSEVFFEYIGNIFNPFLMENNITKPVILFVDGHKTHLNYNLSKLCNELGIILIALYPNSTRILQPADASAFKPIKNGWKKGILNWRRTHMNEAIKKKNVAPILKHVVDGLFPKTLISGFRACGLFPWDPNAIDFSKCLGKSQTDAEPLPDRTMSLGDYEDICGDDLVSKFKDIENVVLFENQPMEFFTLYKVWETFKTGMGSGVDMSTTLGTNTCNVKQDENAVTLQDHTYATPTKNKNITPLQSSGSSLADVLLWPETPKRKCKRNIERVPYVVSSSKWQKLYLDKEENKRHQELEKEERKRKREEKNNNKQAGKIQRVLKEKSNNPTKNPNLEKPLAYRHRNKIFKSEIDVMDQPGCSKDVIVAVKLKSSDPTTFTAVNLDKPKPPITAVKFKKSEPSIIVVKKEKSDPTVTAVKLEKLEPKSAMIGLCYKCGSNFKNQDPESKVECDLCDKTFHTTCLDDINIDEPKSTSIYVCNGCIQFNEEVVDSLKFI